MSNFAFGTYRVSDLNPQHIEALKEAIDSGITMIDTSSNYMDGSAERAISMVLKNLDEDIVDDIEIISKYRVTQNLEEQLSLSLERLELDCIDCYLIEYPEELLVESSKKNINKDDALDNLYAKLFDAFLDLELAVKNKKILSYGISSDAFSLDSSSEYFVPYEDLLTLAQDAADEIKNKTHSFSTIQLPVNILELGGLKAATYAKKNQLRVIANRPLNAFKDNLMYRLADYDESREYYHHLNELMEVCDNQQLKSLYNLLEQLDEKKHKYGWIGDYESFLSTQIIPHMKKALEGLKNSDELDLLLKYIDMFLTEYKKMVAYECSLSTRVALKDNLSECNTSLQEYALSFLLQKENIDFIAVGMRKPSYVNEIVALKQ
jgi:aryl-alcohol dehydrogenase-like predicted oxidoreductase